MNDIKRELRDIVEHSIWSNVACGVAGSVGILLDIVGEQHSELHDALDTLQTISLSFEPAYDRAIKYIQKPVTAESEFLALVRSLQSDIQIYWRKMNTQIDTVIDIHKQSNLTQDATTVSEFISDIDAVRQPDSRFGNALKALSDIEKRLLSP